MNKEQFRISSALKDIIGKELITDEFVAVFELVKNSFDANATKVQIIFKNQYNEKNAKLIIIDDGKGMDYAELKNKWLFVAYSAKKDGLEFGDYRDRIDVNRVFAGAKGIGRFSCDRLGKKLEITTTKDASNAKQEYLLVNWEDFEKNQSKEFIDISVQHDTLTTSPYKTEHGTVLEISGLRDVWDRKRILKLKTSLAKLINPSQGNDSENFQIEIIAEAEKNVDKTKKDENAIVNGVVKNRLFEALEIKTTNMKVAISEDGNFITSTLWDRGDLIYKIKEKNPYISTLRNIKVFLFQLNYGAKRKFYSIMGLPSVQYGSVFMYKNGFRIYPFGEQGEDILKIDKRKAQGYNRFLGTRDIIGRIEINGSNPELRETTSRDGGLVKTETYLNLVDFFYKFVLRRLEKYVVDVIQWGDPKIDRKTKEVIRDTLNPSDVKLEILTLITSLASSHDIVSIEYDEGFLDIIEKKQDKSVDRILKNISRVAKNTDDPELIKEVKKIDKTIKTLQDDAERAIGKAERLKEQSNKLENKLEEQIKETLFVSEAIGDDKKYFMSLQHHIRRTSMIIDKFLNDLIDAIEQNKSVETMLNIVTQIDLKNKEIATLSEFVTKAGFDTKTKKIRKDIVAFTNEYIENVYKKYDYFRNNEKLKSISIKNVPPQTFIMNFRPIELIIIIDNFISNSEKSGASEVVFNWGEITQSKISLHIIDNGNGIEDDILDKIFAFRFSKTDGAGLGLYQTREIIKRMKGNIHVNNKLPKGVEFIITFGR